MFTRTKTFHRQDGSRRQYLQIVKTCRERGKVRQKVVCNLGRVEELHHGGVDTLIEGLAKFSEKLTVIDAGKDLLAHEAKEYGSVLIFHRLFESVGLTESIARCLAQHHHLIPVTDALCAMVLNRILAPGSKLRVYEWLQEVYAPSWASLKLHHLYRSLDVLAQHKEEIEQALYAQVRNLFDLNLNVVFYDTTSVYFEGRGPEGMAQRGFSKDKRPDLKQVVIGILLTEEGIPIGCEVFPGNTYDGTTVKTMLAMLSGRFKLGKIIFVADRGMVSEKNLSLLEAEGYQYIVGVKMRQLRQVRDTVLATPGRYRQVEDNLKVKETTVAGTRYVICFNPQEADKDREDRDAIVANLERKLHGRTLSKVLTGDAKRFCRLCAGEAVLNQDKIAKEARYDGKYVLRTTTTLPSEDVARAYKQLWMVERAFRDLKNIFKIRPVFHWTPSRVHGHIFVCFLAFLLTATLARRLSEQGVKESVHEVIRDVRRMKAVTLEVKHEAYLLRTELKGSAHHAFRAVGLRVPSQVQRV